MGSHMCNPKYWGGRGRKSMNLGPAWATRDLVSKSNNKLKIKILYFQLNAIIDCYRKH